MTQVDTKIISIKDVSDNVPQNINPLIEEDIKKILLDSTTKAQLCSHPILVSVDELKKEKKTSTEVEAQAISKTPQFTVIQPTLPNVVY